MKALSYSVSAFRSTGISFFVASFILLTGCQDSGGEYKESMSLSKMDAMSPPPPPHDESSADFAAAGLTSTSENNVSDTSIPGSGTAMVNKIPSKIRKTAQLNITVEEYKKARTDIEKIVKGMNGYIGSEHETNSTYSISNDMVLRIVNKDFDVMVEKILAIASHVNSKNISAEDVTAQFVDIQSRLKSKKEIEKRYLDILSKASKVTDILEIEQKLGEIREEIEAKEGELKLLSDQVDYSTIYLNFQENFEYTPLDNPGFFGRLGTAFGNGWSGFLTFLVGLVYAWPLWLILGIAAYLLIRLIKRRRNRKKLERK
ncbi:MAG: DUF4349 domain-containing protein [Bacteroidota bacterium]|nr:DUF4349 domain-containing protein [Bacteroidota bacterium]